MKKKIRIGCLLAGLVLVVLSTHAEIIRLSNGTQLEGTIIFQNEEVVVVRDAKGARYQYLLSDVERIVEAEEKPSSPADTIVTAEGQWLASKKVTVAVQLSAGAAIVPHEQTGAAIEGDVVVGTTNLLHRRIMLGGAIGYHWHMGYHFLPVQLRAEMPLSEGKHAPFLALGVGYGFAIGNSKIVNSQIVKSDNSQIVNSQIVKSDGQIVKSGGLYASIGAGYRCQLSPRNALTLGLFSDFQSALIDATPSIDYSGTTITYHTPSRRTFCNLGFRLGLCF